MAAEQASSLPNKITPMDEGTAAEAIFGLLQKNHEPAEAAPEPNSSQPETTEETTEAPAVEATDETQTEEELTFNTLDELAEVTGLPMETLLGLKTKAKVHGEESDVALGDLLKSYQLESHLNEQLAQKNAEMAKLGEERKALEAERAKSNTEFQSRLQEVDAMTKMAEDMFLKEYQKVDWNTLRATDPTEYTLKRQDMAETYQYIQQLKSQATEKAQKAQQEQQDKFQKEFQDILKRENEQLLNKLPDWKDESKAKAEKTKLRNYLNDLGFNEKEISQLTDHRAILALRDGMLYREMQKNSNPNAKKVVTTPKMQKPGVSRGEVEKKADKESELMSRLRKTGKPEDAVDILLNRGFFKGM